MGDDWIFGLLGDCCVQILKKYVLKRDHFPNCHVLDTPYGYLGAWYCMQLLERYGGSTDSVGDGLGDWMIGSAELPPTCWDAAVRLGAAIVGTSPSEC